MSDRIPPQNLEAERALLGCMMVDRDLVPIVTAFVRPDDFYAPVHGPICAAVAGLHQRQQPTDKIAVAAELQALGKLELCGGVAYLSSLLDTVQSASSAEYYAKVVAEKATLRRVIAAAGRIRDLAFDGEPDVSRAIADSENELRNAVSGATQGDFGKSMEDALLDAHRVLEAASMGTKPGVSSPWPQLDMATGRTFGGEVVVWAGAPQTGKSIAAAQTALHIAKYEGAVAFFALEMGIGGTIRRMIGKYSGVSSRRIRMGDLRDSDWERVSIAVAELSNLPIRLFDRTQRKTVSDVRRCVARMAAKEPVTAVFIDHANFLADAMSNQKIPKTERLDAVYQELLQIAAEYDCVMHIVQHLNRAGMEGEPGLINLRDGGNLEGHAHIVIFPYRPNIAGEPERGEFIIAKNREQPLRRMHMRFDGAAQEWQEAFEMEAVA